MKKSTNILWHHGHVLREVREQKLGQRGCVVWFTGLSGSGKSTVASETERLLTEAGHLVYVLDGDNLRHGLNSDLGFGPADRKENIRRVSEVAALMAPELDKDKAWESAQVESFTQLASMHLLQ